VASTLTAPKGPLGVNEDRLAYHLWSGALALPTALQYAIDLAISLRELHHRGLAHGGVQTTNVVTSGSRASLLPARTDSRSTTADDVADFGSVLYQMVTGQRPVRRVRAAEPIRLTPSRSDPDWERSRLIDLAYRCMDGATNIASALTELRLVSIRARHKTQNPALRPTSLVELPPVVELPDRLDCTEPADEPAGEVPSAIPEAHPELQFRTKRVKRLAVPGTHCPRCQSELYPSRPRSPWEHLLASFHLYVCRCHRCFRRRFIFSGVPATVREDTQPSIED
jgi:hypothetical protein